MFYLDIIHNKLRINDKHFDLQKVKSYAKC